MTFISSVFCTLALLLSSVSYGAQPVPNFVVSTLGKPPTAVRLKAPRGHHFNLEAPKSAKLGEQALTIKSTAPGEIQFTVPSNLNGIIKLKAFVCDDANTFCVRKENQIILRSKSKPPGAATVHPVDLLSARKSKSIDPELTAHWAKQARSMGFVYNNPKQAFAKARALKKPLLIDFFAIWCPPCNQLDETVFPTQKYKTAAQDFITLKLDADHPSSWGLKEKYNIQSYPTVIFVQPDGKEISRLVGVLKPEQFVMAMAEAKQGKAWTPEKLPPELAFDADKDKPQVLITKISSLLQTKAYKATEWQEQDLLSILADAQIKLGQKEQAKATFAKAVNIYESLVADLGSQGRYNRGYNLELAYALSESGQQEKAELLYQRLRRRYPDEFTFHYAFSKFLRRQNRESQALAPAKLAYRHSYGDNKLRAGLNLAELYFALDSKVQARNLAQKLIHTTDIPTSPHVRTHRYLQQLRDFNKTFSAEN